MVARTMSIVMEMNKTMGIRICFKSEPTGFAEGFAEECESSQNGTAGFQGPLYSTGQQKDLTPLCWAKGLWLESGGQMPRDNRLLSAYSFSCCPGRQRDALENTETGNLELGKCGFESQFCHLLAA